MFKVESPPSGWDASMPSWVGMNDERGLKSWGSRNYKKKNIKNPWTESSFCRATIQKAISRWIIDFALPPVVTGMRPKKSKKKKNTKGSGRGGHGHAKGLKVLVPARKGEPEIDLYWVFIIIVHAHYCKHLNPAVPAGSTGADAIMWALNKPHMRKRLLSSVGLLSRHTSTIYLHDILSRHTSTIHFHDIVSRHTSTPEFQDIHPRYTFTTCIHVILSRHRFKT